ncbi:MAG: capsular polysaccharide biosynthesis protein [Parasporobacterium sp.]|nr:capsular polysaccharide biosynthesis protein [Parasporobacterium sp.]
MINMPIIDFHTHILPGIDDGSPDVATSLLMLDKMRKDGITHVAATPHFYADEMTIDSFLENRRAAYRQLLAAENTGITVIPGAEVYYFRGMSNADAIHSLCIGGDEVLLLELPFTDWDDSVIDEVHALTGRYTVILAHLERYIRFHRNRKKLRELMDMDLYVQVNAESVQKRSGCYEKDAVKWLKEGCAHVLGSDCHGISRRIPDLKEGRNALAAADRRIPARIDEAGRELLHRMHAFCR